MKKPMSPSQELAYIAAFIDGEGWIMNRHLNDTGKLQRKIGFTNTNKILFDTVVAMLVRAGFEMNIRHRPSKNPKHSDRWDCVIKGGKQSFERFLRIIPLQHPDKKKRLQEMVDNYLTVDKAGRKRAEARWKDSTEASRKAHSKKMLDKRWGR